MSTLSTEFEDWLIWPTIHPDHLWVYDKLILSRKLGYVCGPVGVPVPKSGRYIVRPITNPLGMGCGAQFVYIKEDTDHLPLGHFWCEIFEGRHLSVDYVNKQQVLCVEGIRNEQAPLYKWSKWLVVDDIVPFPSILKDLPYPNINCEFIGDKLIEVHLRLNPDFQNGITEAVPVWEGESTLPPDGYAYKESPDFLRQGFFVR